MEKIKYKKNEVYLCEFLGRLREVEILSVSNSAQALLVKIEGSPYAEWIYADTFTEKVRGLIGRMEEEGIFRKKKVFVSIEK